MINKDLWEGQRDPAAILSKIKAVQEAHSMLDLNDLHRIQAIQNLKETMKHANSIF